MGFFLREDWFEEDRLTTKERSLWAGNWPVFRQGAQPPPGGLLLIFRQPTPKEGTLYALPTWDAENRLVGMETHPTAVTTGVPRRRLTFAYDSQSRRTRKTVQTWNGSSWEVVEDIRFLWDGWLLVAELEAESRFPLPSREIRFAA